VTLLIDTNIFLELILDQERASEAGRLLRSVDHHTCFASDFSLHSIGILLFRLGRHADFWQFWQDMVLNGALDICVVTGEDMASVADAARSFGLDFDDAYQYVVADNNELTIVSYDTDFDRTDRGRATPAQILSR